MCRTKTGNTNTIGTKPGDDQTCGTEPGFSANFEKEKDESSRFTCCGNMQNRFYRAKHKMRKKKRGITQRSVHTYPSHPPPFYNVHHL
ncbi:hypothetical protein F511_47476 [Dorcoceras hygrometricum]|uniref:Uncharacterized protein n=1 Tax=Dorcoceras hygrometricum TaxID=472368 RepID=A0A2Z6ZRH7_9LAMI|nr:hypothetical protein F511_47476 [Dorcoceras hygrometricum]